MNEYELIKTNGAFVVGHSTKSMLISKDQYFKVESLLKNQPWSNFILHEDSLIGICDNNNFVVQPISDFPSWQIKDKLNENSELRLAIEVKSVPWINKICLITQVGTKSFLQLKPNVLSNELDISSDKVNEQALGIHHLDKWIVLEL